jgi:Flp pilus assembly protein TadG
LILYNQCKRPGTGFGAKFRPGKLALFLRDTGGAIAVVAALAMPVIIGFVGVGVEVGLWFHTKRGLQSAADAAALSGAYERLAGNSNSVATSAAGQAATINGYDGTIGDSIVVNIPPLSGEFVGNSSAVEVIMRRDLALLFSSVFMAGNITIDAYAVATLVEATGEFCVLSLDDTASSAISIGGNVDVTLDCGIASNSNAADAVDIFGSAIVSVTDVTSVGSITVGGSSILDTVNGTREGLATIADPYAGVPEPAPGACDYSSEIKVTNGQTVTLSPGTYCGGITNLGGHLEFQPGVYILNGDEFKLGGGTTVGEDVMFYLTGDANVQINGNTEVDLKADPDGDNVGDDYTGMLFFQDPTSSGTVNNFNGGALMSLQGVIYFPSQPLNFIGGAGNDGCTVLVGNTVSFNGNADLLVDCETAGVEPPRPPGNVALAG